RDHLEALAGRTAVVWDPGNTLEGVPGLDGSIRLAIGLEHRRAFHHIADLDAGMDVAAGADAGRDFRHAEHHGVALREIDVLQRGALDACLLGKCRNGDDGSGDGSRDERFPGHGFLPRQVMTAWTYRPGLSFS